MFVEECIGAVHSSFWREAIAEFGQDVVEVVVGHVVQRLYHLSGPPLIWQTLHEGSAIMGMDPAGSEIVQIGHFFYDTSGQALFVFFDSNGHGFAIYFG